MTHTTAHAATPTSTEANPTSVPPDPTSTGRPNRRARRPRRPHVAGGARIIVTGLATTATLTIVAVMAAADRTDTEPPRPSNTRVERAGPSMGLGDPVRAGTAHETGAVVETGAT